MKTNGMLLRLWMIGLLAGLAMTFGASAAPRTWDGTTGNWSDAARWGGTVPQNDDAVTLPAGSYTITLDSSTAELASYTQEGGTLFFTNWTTALRAETVTMNDGKMDHAICNTNAAPGVTNRVYIKADNVIIGQPAIIDVAKRGFPGAGPGGETFGHGPEGGKFASNNTGGGGYGGNGGSVGVYGGGVYGSATHPNDPGSGGAARSTHTGGAGGGVARIEAIGRVTVNGEINADGGDYVGSEYAGGGSGGSVWISCETFTGSGRITANGGMGRSYLAGGGGGGRVAIHYHAAAQEAAALVSEVTFAVSGGERLSTWKAESGTLYMTDGQALPWRWAGGGVLLFDPGVTLVSRQYPYMEFSGGVLDFRSVEIRFAIAGGVVSTGLWSTTANNFLSQVLFSPETDLTVNGNLTMSNSVMMVGTNLTLSGSVHMPHQARMVVHSTSNHAARVICPGDWTMANSSTFYVHASETNANFPVYGALVDIGGDMTVAERSWVYPDVWNNRNTNNTLGPVLFKMNDLTISTNSGFNANNTGYEGGRTNLFWYGLGPGGGSTGWQSGGGGYGGAGAMSGSGRGMPYGCTTNANQLGSGGGVGESRGYNRDSGAGGGAIWIQSAGNVIMDGTLTANGQSVPLYNGGGSGGGILVQAVGSVRAGPVSVLSAVGGNAGTYNGGGGGGGRIAVWQKVPEDERALLGTGLIRRSRIEESTEPFFGIECTPQVGGGTGKVNGAAGTTLFLTLLPPQGTLIFIK